MMDMDGYVLLGTIATILLVAAMSLIFGAIEMIVVAYIFLRPFNWTIALLMGLITIGFASLIRGD